MDLQSIPFSHSGIPPALSTEGTAKNRTSQKPLLTTARNSWSWLWDSNPQPADYKSAALPIELNQPLRYDQEVLWKY
jgi:hypothetical protein